MGAINSARNHELHKAEMLEESQEKSGTGAQTKNHEDYVSLQGEG